VDAGWIQLLGPHILEQVQFASAVEKVISGRFDFLEISPHPVLASSLKQCLKRLET